MFRKLVLDGEISRFDESLPIGNGKIGALLYRGNPLRVSVDRNDVWDIRTPEWRTRENFNIKRQMELIAEGNLTELRKSFNASGQTFPTKLPVNKMELVFKGEKTVEKNVLDLSDGLAEIVYKDGIRVKSFISLACDLGFILSDAPYAVRFDPLRSEKTKETDNTCYSLCDLGFQPSREWEKDGVYLSTQETLDGNEYSVGYVTEKTEEGYLMVFGVGYSYLTENYLEKFIGQLKDGLKLGFYTELSRSRRIWARYYSKSYVKLSSVARDIQKQYDLGEYFFRSNCRKDGLPVALQGVWTADNNSLPPWRGDFHFDTNVEMTYWAYLKANHKEEGRNIIDYMWEKRSVFARYTKKFFFVDGIIVPGCMDASGEVMGGWAPYSLSATTGIWASQVFDEYYRYTADEKFLKTRAYPFFKEVARAMMGLLKEKDGKLHLPLSSSPEIYDDTPRAYLKPESNFDLAQLRYCFLTLIDYCKRLGKDYSEYENVLSRLDDLHAWDNAGLEISAADKYLGHTNLAHSIAIFPLCILDYDDPHDKELIDKTIDSLEWYGTGSWVGHTFVWMINHYALSRHGNAAAYFLSVWCKVFASVNGFHLNGDYKHLGATQFHYRPFTLEANFGFNCGLQEMLVKNRKGYVELFPAIPEEWDKSLSFKLAVYGGHVVECVLKDGVIEKLIVNSSKGGEITFKSKYLPEPVTKRLKRGKNSIIVSGSVVNE